MSRNLANGAVCAQCPAEAEDIVLEEEPRPITKEDTIGFSEFEGMLVAKAHCKWCCALYLAWIDESNRSNVGRRFRTDRINNGRPFDLSYRSTFNDQPWILDLPVFHVARFDADDRPALQRIGVIEHDENSPYFSRGLRDEAGDRARAHWQARRDHLVALAGTDGHPPVDDSRLLPLAIFIDELNPARSAVTMWSGRDAPEVFESIMPKSKKCDVLIHALRDFEDRWPMVLTVHLERTTSFVLPNGWVAVVARWSGE